MAEIQVKTPSGSYAIIVRPGLLTHLNTFEGLARHRSVVISNTTVAPYYSGYFTPPPINAVLVNMPDGERYKTLQTVQRLYARLVSANLDRGSQVIALGGGVVGDTAGFVAATYMRGIRLVQVPTSLLAMVDSSVGGKVGVDLPQGKNLVGAFKQPEVVLIDPNVLDTLPEDEWRNGMAEIIKHGLLADDELLDPVLHTPDRRAELVVRAIKVKVDVVQRDPYEKAERAYLNLGHTFAHAIEQVSNYHVPHGQAVAVGLLAAARLSYAVGLCEIGLVDLVDGMLAQLNMRRSTGGLEPEALWQAMTRDKKWQDGVNRFILLRDVGQPLIMEDVDKNRVIAVLESLR